MPRNNKNPRSLNKGEKLKGCAPDFKEIKTVREIVHLIAKTTSQMRIFTTDYVHIPRFTEELFDKLKAFLDKYGNLELGVHEFSLTYKTKTAYTDKPNTESIPYLFYRNGVRSLFFYSDLTKDEFLDFLDIIKKEVNLPAVDSDIVISLWEKDFVNIRYYTSGEFLENIIGLGVEQPKYNYDPDSLVKGKIKLDDEDRKALGEAILSEKLASEKNDLNRDVQEIIKDGMPPLSYALDKAEIKKLEDMLARNRSITAEEELVALIIEMLYLENRLGPFQDIVDALDQCHEQLLAMENYPLAVRLINSVIEFKEILYSQGDDRHPVIKTFLDRITSSESLADLQKYITEDQLLAPESLLEYLNILGPKSIPVLSYLYEHDKRPHFRTKVLDVLKKQGKADIQNLMNFVHDEKTDFTKAIISVLSEVNGKNSIQHLARIANYSNREIKGEAVKALGKHVDMTANKILLAVLKDNDVEMRIQAAQSCQHVCDNSLKEHILSTVKSKAFKKKSDEEIKAFLELLGRIGSEQAYQILRSFLRKARILTGPRAKEMGLNAILALESLGTSEARVILEEGTRMQNKSLKQACRQSLQNLTGRY